MKTPIKTKRFIRIPDVMPATWIELDADLNEKTADVIKRFMKNKEQREGKVGRWSGKDYLNAHKL